MDKLNFVSNPRIVVFLKDAEAEEDINITPDQIPGIIIPALYEAIGDEIILSLSIFAYDEYDDHVRALVNTWDGVCALQRHVKLYGDGSYEYIRKNNGRTLWQIM